jgi:CubicO group peptidase (beta-lactamase class C family)
MKRYSVMILIIIFCFWNYCDAQISQTIGDLMQQYFNYGEFNGSVLVSKNGQVIFKKGFGYANFEQRIPNTPDIKFYIGSITKAFTDLIMLQMAERGIIKLDAKISDYLPEYPKPYADSVTIYNLLTHTSGIPDYDGDPRIDVDWSKHYSHNEMLALFDSLPLLFTPGAKFSYTNAGTYICGVIMEKLTGKSYEELLKENILDPLQMNNTGYTESHGPIDKFARGYDLSSVKPVAQRDIDASTAFSAFGMYSTAEDMQKWNEALHTEKLLSKKYMDIYFTPYREKWACDWVVAINPFHNASDSTIVTTRGGTYGRFMCFTVRFVKEKHSIVLMCNSRFSRAEEIIRNITAILFNRPYTLPRKSLQKTFSETIDKKSLADAVNDILNKAKDTSNYYISASEFLHIGYVYKYDKKDLKSAIQVFELVAKFFPTTYNALDSEFFPDSSNVYGILGESYIADGQKDKALASLRKAIDLNPNDTQAIELVKKLEKE